MNYNNSIFIEPLKKYIRYRFPGEYNDKQLLMFGFTTDDLIDPLVERVLDIPVIFEYTPDYKDNVYAKFRFDEFKIYIYSVNKKKFSGSSSYWKYVMAVIFHEMVHAVDYLKKLYTEVSYNEFMTSEKYYSDPEEVRAYRAMMKIFMEDTLKMSPNKVMKLMQKYTTDTDKKRGEWLKKIREIDAKQNRLLHKAGKKKITEKMVKDPQCPPEILKKALINGQNHWIAYYAAQNPNCPSEALQMVLERGKSDWVSCYAALNRNCPPEALQMVLGKGKNDMVSCCAARNPNCPPEARLKWLMATGQIKMPDLSKHDIQVIKDYNKPDEEWEQFKRMVEDE